MPTVCDEEEEFTCLSTGSCIDRIQVCDKMADCADLRRAEFKLKSIKLHNWSIYVILEQ